MIVEVTRLVAGMVVMLAGLFLLASLVAVAVVIEVAKLVARVIVMFAGLFRCHISSPSRVTSSKQRMVTLDPSAADIPRTKR
jgi:hypothetical protein